MKFSAAMDRDSNRQAIFANGAFKLESTWTFAAATTGATGQHTIFTVTGNVFVDLVFGICDTSLDSGGAATISVGSANNVGGFIQVTTATVIDDGDVWYNNTPLVEIGNLLTSGAVPGWAPINDGADITFDILTATITAGALDMYLLWRPLSSDGNITVTTPA